MPDSPVTISILVLNESTMLTVASVIDPLRAANRLSGDDRFSWQLYSTSDADIRLTGGVSMAAHDQFNDQCQGDVLLVVASFNQRTHARPATIQALQRVASRYKITGGIEAGTWLLARAGLVGNRRVTTHWEDFENLANNYPELSVVADRFVIDGKFWTCGGANPALDMMLELITRYYDRATAVDVARVFIYHQSNTATDPQPKHSLGTIERREPRVAAAVRLMEDAIEEPLTSSAIADALGISKRTLEQLFRRYLDCPPHTYYLRLRLIAARKMVIDSHFSVQQISVLTGFSSQSSLSRAFRHMYGVSPGTLRR
ncbi:MAG: GlxA family transcriptional regulator [Pseudomonadota bacterium]